VLGVHASADPPLLLFLGHRSILAWGEQGQLWESPRLSDEGIEIGTIADGLLHGLGWDRRTDRETPFTLNLKNGQLE
jgi:hypothetical protein